MAPSLLRNVPVVLVPGMKGSILADRLTGQRVWLDGNVALSDQLSPSTSLKLPRVFENGVQRHDGLQSSGIVEDITFLYLYKMQFYGAFLHALRGAGREVHVFHYDWRRSLLEAADQLEAFVLSVCARSGAQVQLVCHSMGGMAGMMLLNRHPEWFHSVLFAGTPFQPTAPRWIEEVSVGKTVGLNRQILAADVAFSFTSCYAFLPPHGQGMVDAHGNEIVLDYYDPQVWVERQFSVFHPKHPHSVVGREGAYREAYAYLCEALRLGREVRRQIQCRPGVKYPPLALLSGNGHPVKTTVVADGPKAFCGYDWTSAYPSLGPTHIGDDVADVPSTQLPQGYRYTQYFTKYVHRVLLSDTSKAHGVLLDLHHQVTARLGPIKEKRQAVGLPVHALDVEGAPVHVVLADT